MPLLAQAEAEALDNIGIRIQVEAKDEIGHTSAVPFHASPGKGKGKGQKIICGI